MGLINKSNYFSLSPILQPFMQYIEQPFLNPSLEHSRMPAFLIHWEKHFYFP